MAGRDEKGLQVLEILLRRAAMDPSFRKKLFSDSPSTLKDWDLPIDIRTLIVRFLTNPANLLDSDT
jgi:hypothetical protein